MPLDIGDLFRLCFRRVVQGAIRKVSIDFRSSPASTKIVPCSRRSIKQVSGLIQQVLPRLRVRNNFGDATGLKAEASGLHEWSHRSLGRARPVCQGAIDSLG